MAAPKRNLSAAAIVVDTEEGSYLLKIDGYSRTKVLLQAGKCAISTRFSVGGHDWALEFYPNGCESADFVSVYLLLDSADAKDVTASFAFSVLDKDGEPVPSFSRTHSGHTFQQGKSSAWGYYDFIKKTDLEGSLHLIDDCFTIRCDVTVMKGIRTEEQHKRKRSQLALVPPSNLHRHLGNLLKSMDGADVIFHVGGERFSAHRSVLAARSSVFKAELFGSMKEKIVDKVEIFDMESDVFKSLLHFIYTDSLPEQTTHDGEAHDDVVMAGHLLVAADMYNIDRLKLICEEMLCNHIDSTIVATSLTLSEQHGCHELKEACFEFLASPSNLEAMVTSDGYEHLKSSCPSVLREMIARFLPPELKAAKDIIMTI
ncbi:BTB/POZ and MATH domain-containing protein 3-like [Lolium rigidum]|uniref:BTB/POZ and MATH domain-containing protein 3-like n=1 Tax=Lolium rigidum TaxID=89674 RepID=UPI001F5DEDE3|nr:BTB/POZ and MATH domain-containing protein 3-like [Lolium rigidum]